MAPGNVRYRIEIAGVLVQLFGRFADAEEAAFSGRNPAHSDGGS